MPDDSVHDGARVNPGWVARLELEFVRSPGRTDLGHREHRGPLRVQRAFHPEGDVAHVYVLHPPGGMVGGDEIVVDVRVQQGCAALLTTPAAQKLYRSVSAESRQQVALRVLPEASLEWLPGETIAFDGARFRQTTRVVLSPGASFIGWEMGCFGRPANDVAFARGHLSIAFEIFRDELPLLLERQRIDGGSSALSGAHGYAGLPAWGTLYATLGATQSADAIALVAAVLSDADPETRAGVTTLDDLLVVRISAPSLARVRELLTSCWMKLRPALLGRAPCPPRIWAT